MHEEANKTSLARLRRGLQTEPVTAQKEMYHSQIFKSYFKLNVEEMSLVWWLTCINSINTAEKLTAKRNM